jgi:hypothetical protein
MKYVFLVILVVILSSCGSTNDSTGSGNTSENNSNSTLSLTKEALKENPETDIFVFKGRVYERGNELTENVDLVKIGQILTDYKGGSSINEGEATKLKKGTIVYKDSSEKTSDVLIVKVNDEMYEYIGKPEG